MHSSRWTFDLSGLPRLWCGGSQSLVGTAVFNGSRFYCVNYFAIYLRMFKAMTAQRSVTVDFVLQLSDPCKLVNNTDLWLTSAAVCAL